MNEDQSFPSEASHRMEKAGVHIDQSKYNM